jgi:hypothetical protein
MKKEIRYSIFLVLTLGLFSLFTTSCTKEKEEEPEVKVSDKIFYEQLGYTLIRCYTDIYNQNLAGKPTGGQNITTVGPMGGDVVITGSDTYDNTHGITTTDLFFNLNNVKYVQSKSSTSGNTTATTDITITGETSFFGSFSDTYTSLNYQSQSLHIVGSVTYAGTTRYIDTTGMVNINRSATTSVNICGHLASW